MGSGEDARDLTQETFLRAFRALKGFKGQAKFSSWLYRITLNLCRDWIRRPQQFVSIAGSVRPEFTRAALETCADPERIDIAEHGAGFFQLLGRHVPSLRPWRKS